MQERSYAKRSWALLTRDKGWIKPYGVEADRRKEYIITDEGKRVLVAELDRLQELVDNGNKHINR